MSLKESGLDIDEEQEKRLKEHYDNPKNNKALEDYNARGIGKNPDNWGQVDIYLLVDKDEKIKNMGYEYKGCPTIAFAASLYTQDLKTIPLKEALSITNNNLDQMNAQENCDDCLKMILVAFIAAYENYIQRIKGVNKEDYISKFIETTIPYTEQACAPTMPTN